MPDVSLAVQMAQLPDEERLRILGDLLPEQAESLIYDWRFWSRPDQRPPAGDWFGWLLLSGRGAGKTRTGSEWIVERVKNGFKRLALIGQTKADVRDTMVELGDSSIMQVTPPSMSVDYEPSKRRLNFPEYDAVATIYSGDEPDQLRGPQHDSAWIDELAKFKYPELTWDNMEMGLRIGTDPRVVITSTPRPVPIIKRLITDTNIVVTRVSTYANIHNLAPAFVQRLLDRYEGTRIGRQELHGEVLDDNPDALWNREAMIDPYRVLSVPDLRRIVVAVDPPGSATGAECGIVVCGRGHDEGFYVLEDGSLRGSPETWGRQAVQLYLKWQADRVVGEVNNGGDMIENTIRTIRDENDKPVGRQIPFTAVRATRGKALRAEPVAALYEQGKGRHVGQFAELEDQLCQWDASMNESPDRLDALVWGATELMLGDYQATWDDVEGLGTVEGYNSRWA